MAKRQRRDSVQEAMAERMDEAPRQKRHYTVISIPVIDLTVGDRIVSRVNHHTGRPSATEEVKTIEHDVRGCRNTHVNGDKCYDRSGRVDVSILESAGTHMLPDGSYGTEQDFFKSFGIK